MDMARTTPLLNADDWARAGFEALVEHGLEGVAVERVAARLHATKGSFYWHFANRDGLVVAVLELWQAETEAIIALLDSTCDARERLRQLFAILQSEIRTDRAEIDLLGRRDNPLVAPVVAQVSQRRIDFLTATLRDAGLPPALARDNALHTYALWLGLLQLQQAMPSGMPTGAARKRFLHATSRLLEHLLDGN